MKELIKATLRMAREQGDVENTMFLFPMPLGCEIEITWVAEGGAEAQIANCRNLQLGTEYFNMVSVDQSTNNFLHHMRLDEQKNQAALENALPSTIVLIKFPAYIGKKDKIIVSIEHPEHRVKLRYEAVRPNEKAVNMISDVDVLGIERDEFVSHFKLFQQEIDLLKNKTVA